MVCFMKLGSFSGSCGGFGESKSYFISFSNVLCNRPLRVYSLSCFFYLSSQCHSVTVKKLIGIHPTYLVNYLL